MEPVIPLFILLGVGIAIASAAFGGSRWKEIADEFGLEYGSFLQRSLTGTVEGFRVRVVQHKNNLEIEVGGSSIRNTISLSKEGFLSGIIGGRDIEVGCPSFDANTYISSFSRESDAEVAALLDRETRELISKYVVMGGAKVADGEISHTKTNSIDSVPQLIRGHIQLAKHLGMENFEIPARLAVNALNDSVSSVRLRNLTLLQERFPSSEEAADTSAALLNDPQTSIQLAAAIFMGEKGLGVVKEIAQSDGATIDLRIKSLRHLANKVERDELITISRELLQSREKQLQRMGIHFLGRLKDRASLDSMIALLEPRNIATTLKVIEAVESIGDSSAERALIKLLEDSNNRVKTAAIGALETVGTITAVEPLHLLAKRLAFKRLARKAIESIQSRLGDVESGRLSLAPSIDPNGALSLAGNPEKTGGLSLEEE